MSPSPTNLGSNQISNNENLTSTSTSSSSLLLNSKSTSSILSQLSSATHSTNFSLCHKSLSTIKLSLATHKQKNRRLLAASGAAAVLAASFRHFSAIPATPLHLLSSILAALIPLYPADDRDLVREFASPDPLHAIASVLRSPKSSDSLNAILLLKQIVPSDADLGRAAARIDGLVDSLMNRRSGRTARLAVFYLAGSCEEWMAARLVGMGFVSMVVECVGEFDADKRVVEAGLSAIDGLCGFELGREKVCENALFVPVVVKKIFGCSDLATDLAVSLLWKLFENWEGGESGCVVEALEVGVFVKLLMLLQVECREEVKERVTKLLRFFKGFRGNACLECVDEFDFRGIRRPL